MQHALFLYIIDYISIDYGTTPAQDYTPEGVL